MGKKYTFALNVLLSTPIKVSDGVEKISKFVIKNSGLNPILLLISPKLLDQVEWYFISRVLIARLITWYILVLIKLPEVVLYLKALIAHPNFLVKKNGCKLNFLLDINVTIILPYRTSICVNFSSIFVNLFFSKIWKSTKIVGLSNEYTFALNELFFIPIKGFDGVEKFSKIQIKILAQNSLLLPISSKLPNRIEWNFIPRLVLV